MMGKSESIAAEIKQLLGERPQVAVVLAEILGPPLALRKEPPEAEEPQSR